MKKKNRQTFQVEENELEEVNEFKVAKYESLKPRLVDSDEEDNNNAKGKRKQIGGHRPSKSKPEKDDKTLSKKKVEVGEFDLEGANATNAQRLNKKHKKECTLIPAKTDPLPRIFFHIGWGVKPRSGEVDLDGSCLLFDKYGFYIETIFWDNLISEDQSIKHLGDKLVEEGSDEEDDKEKPDQSQENIVIDFEKISPKTTTVIFAINIFSAKTFSRMNNIKLTVKNVDKNEIVSTYTLEGNKDIKPYSDYNTLVLCKIYKNSLIVKENTWLIQMIEEPYNISYGSTIDTIIPTLKDKHVQPLAATWSSLFIKVKEGKGLDVKDITGKSDPYIRIKYDLNNEPKKWKTKAKYRTVDPVWEDDNDLEIPFDNNLHVLRVECYDKDFLGKDELIGQFMLTLSKIPTNEEYSRWFSLKGKKKKEIVVTGSIFLTIYKRLESIEND